MAIKSYLLLYLKMLARSFIFAIAASVACTGSPVPAPVAPKSFVKPSGTHFELNGEPYYYAGESSWTIELEKRHQW